MSRRIVDLIKRLTLPRPWFRHAVRTCLLLASFVVAAPAWSQPVSIELVLAVDVSASVDDEEYALQMQGIASALRDADVVAAIVANGDLGVAVTLVQWSAGPDQVQAIDWRRLRNRDDALAFADAVDAAPRRVEGRTTAIGSAVAFARRLMDENQYVGIDHVIDVSGDGRNNDGEPLFRERRAAATDGVTINGLAIENDDPRLPAYFENYVIAGPGSFVVVARDFDDFARAMRKKLLRELTPLLSEDWRERRLAALWVEDPAATARFGRRPTAATLLEKRGGDRRIDEIRAR